MILTRTPKLEFPWLLRKLKPRIIGQIGTNAGMCGDEGLFIAVYDICRLQTADCRLQTADCRPQTAAARL